MTPEVKHQGRKWTESENGENGGDREMKEGGEQASGGVPVGLNMAICHEAESLRKD